MDYEKIGNFIATERKAKKLTQTKLAEKIFVSEKTISKWENGKGVPDTNSLTRLCDVFDISLNELLSGERNTTKDDTKNDKVLLDMAKELEIKNKIIWNSMWVIMIISMISFLSGTFLVAFLMPEGIWQTLTVVGILIVFLIPCFYALKLEVSVGTYKCNNCGHEIVPTYQQALWAIHRGTTRYLKCPNCKKRTWCKKKIK